MPDAAVRIPNAWDPRPYQLPLWRYLENGGKRAVAVWHRRAGKDSLALNWTARAAHQQVGVYWHLAPRLNQARKIVWDGIDRQGRRMIDQAFPPEIRAGVNEAEMKIPLRNGSLWQLVGSDNYDSLIGANPVGVVFSEYSVADPAAWEFLRPILAENGGWAVFLYTPRGRNHGADLYDMAKGLASWFCELLTVDDTGAIGPEIIEEERASGMPEDMVQQEYFCSFDTAVSGSYYGKYLIAAEQEGRIGRVPWEPALDVMTAWDLGIDDATAIWFCQRVGREIRLIDYYESSGVGLEHYAKVLKERPYAYGDHVFPHDVEVRELGSGKSRKEILASLGIRVRVAPKLPLEDGIAGARKILPACWFDAAKCARGVKALREYQREWDDKLKTFKGSPRHDWTSHAADAFRYLTTGMRRDHGRGERPRFAEMGYDETRGPPTGEMMQPAALWDGQHYRPRRGGERPRTAIMD